jgi:hypothetical protein
VRGVGGFAFNVGLPVGEFANNVSDAGFGADLTVGAHLGRSPVALGVDLGFLVYGRSVRTVPFSTTVPIRVDLVTTNSLVQPHLFLRLQPTSGPVQPYVEALGGFKYLFTETRVRDEDRFENRDIASETNFGDFAWSGGGGAGLDFVVYRPRPERRSDGESSVRSVGIQLGFQYLLGQEAEYVADTEIEDTNGNGVIDRSELDIRRSRTDLVVFRVGAAVRF